MDIFAHTLWAGAGGALLQPWGRSELFDNHQSPRDAYC